MANAPSGADKIESVLFMFCSRYVGKMIQGQDVDECLNGLDREWRSFAEENNRKVKEAPKIQGNWGYSGLSSLHHRWADPDKVKDEIAFIRNWIENNRFTPDASNPVLE